MPRSVIAAGFLSFFLLGAIQSLYGPAQFALRAAFGVSPSQVGVFLSALFAGSVSGVVSYPVLERLLSKYGLSKRGALLVSSGLLALGCAGVASSTLWGLALLAVFLTGLGYGGANIGFNTLFSRGFGSRSASMTNLLHAVFGIGSIGGPLLVGGLRGDFRGPFWIGAACGVALLGLSLNLRRTSSDGASGELVTESATESSSGSFRVTPGLLLFTLLFLVYVVVEVGASSSEPRHLSDALGFTPQNAAFINSLFWGGLTVGRLIGASLGLRVAAPHLVLGAAALVAVSLLLTHLSGFAPVAYTLAGLACGPIFPTALVWLTRVVPGGAAATSVVVAAASGGGIVAAQAVNLIARDAGTIPGALSLYAGLLVAVVIAIRWQTVAYATAKT